MNTEKLSLYNEKFIDFLKTEFCENGYFYKNSAFRKLRGKHLFIIEAELIVNEEGMLSPKIRVADVKVKRNKAGETRTIGGVLDDEATVESVKGEKNCFFYKTLRHLKEMEYSEEIPDSDILEIAKSAFVASAVCENKGIDRQYKKLCRNDVPSNKAAGIAAIEAVSFFVALTLILGILAGLTVWAILRYKKILGLFTVPYFYLFTAVISVIYGIIAYRKIKSGRF